MAFEANRAYNDPALGAAFSNIAKMFAPPSGSDLAGYAVANSKRAEAQRLADLYGRAGNAGMTAAEMTALDQQMAVVNGGWGNSRWKYTQDDTTTRRGQDVTAQTSVGNNQRDNQRALIANRNDNSGAAIRSLYGALSPGQIRPAVPEEVAGMVGLPAIPEAQGTTRPQTLDQWQAQQAEQLKQGGQWSPDMTVDVIMGRQTPVEAIGPGGKPVFMAPGTAVRQGAQPAPTTGADTEVSKLIKERDALPPGDPNRAAYDSRLAALGRGQQQAVYDKQSDEALAKLNEEIFNNATKATTDRGTYAALEAAANNPDVTQGVLGPASLGLKKALNSFGLNVGDTGPAEMLNALGNQISLRLRDPSGGAGMPGALSDSDREFLRTMTLSLGNSPEANKMLAQYYLASQQRAIDLDTMRQQYIAKNGRLDEGFRGQMSEYLRSNDPTLTLRSRMAGGQPVRVNSPADAEKLPPGTPIIWTENGVEHKGTVPQ